MRSQFSITQRVIQGNNSYEITGADKLTLYKEINTQTFTTSAESE